MTTNRFVMNNDRTQGVDKSNISYNKCKSHNAWNVNYERLNYVYITRVEMYRSIVGQNVAREHKAQLRRIGKTRKERA